MTKRQLNKAVNVVKNDATLMHKYYNPETGDACVIGGLALATGFSKRSLARMKGAIDYRDTLLRHIRKHFGLSKPNQVRLQTINDTRYDLVTRRADLISALKHIFKDNQTK